MGLGQGFGWLLPPMRTFWCQELTLSILWSYDSKVPSQPISFSSPLQPNNLRCLTNPTPCPGSAIPDIPPPKGTVPALTPPQGPNQPLHWTHTALLGQGLKNKSFQGISGAFPVLQAPRSHRWAVWSSVFGYYSQKPLISNTAGGEELHSHTSLWPASIPGAFCACSYD